MLDAVHQCESLELKHIVLFDSVSAARAGVVSVLKQHGLKKTFTKVLGVVVAKIERKLGMTSNSKLALDYAAKHGIACTVTSDVNSTDTRSLLRQNAPDLILVCSFSQIIRQSVIELPRIGIVNVHPSLLPKYRGPEPVFWALFHNESKTGVTFHKLEASVDAGDILAQVEASIPADTDLDQLTDSLFQLAGEHVAKTLVAFANGDKDPQPQTQADASYFSFPTPEQRRQLRQR